MLACIALCAALLACRDRSSPSSPSSDDHIGSAASTPVSAPAPASNAPGQDVPTQCQRYRALVTELEHCPKLPPQLLDGIKRSYDTIVHNAGISTGGPDARSSLDRACQQAAETFRRVRASYCGP